MLMFVRPFLERGQPPCNESKSGLERHESILFLPGLKQSLQNDPEQKDREAWQRDHYTISREQYYFLVLSYHLNAAAQL